MESNYKEKIIEKYSGGSEVNRAAQTGEYGMEFIYTKKALDGYIDPSKRVIELGCGGGYTNADVILGDATQLIAIADESYDVVLCLGPLYHLKREDRKQCIAECKRI